MVVLVNEVYIIRQSQASAGALQKILCSQALLLSSLIRYGKVILLPYYGRDARWQQQQQHHHST